MPVIRCGPSSLSKSFVLEKIKSEISYWSQVVKKWINKYHHRQCRSGIKWLILKLWGQNRAWILQMAKAMEAEQCLSSINGENYTQIPQPPVWLEYINQTSTLEGRIDILDDYHCYLTCRCQVSHCCQLPCSATKQILKKFNILSTDHKRNKFIP